MAEDEPTYIEELEEETFGLPVDEVTPAAIRELDPVKGLKLLSRPARLGGKLNGHLTRLTEEELDARAERANEFLARPPVEYPADDAAHPEEDR